MFALLGLLACGSPPPPEIVARPGGVEVRAEGILGVEVRSPDGLPLARQQAAAPVDVLELGLQWAGAGEHEVIVRTEDGQLSQRLSPDLRPMQVLVEAPAGQSRLEVSDGDKVPLTLIDGQPAQVAVSVIGWVPGPARVRLGAEERSRPKLGRGERLSALATVGEETEVEVEAGGSTTHFTLVPEVISAAQASEGLALREVVFPADPAGMADLARPQGRVTLPAAWLRPAQRRLGLGRLEERWAPWSYVGVLLENTTDKAVNLVVRMQVLEADGAPAAAFLPRLREGDDGSGVVRVLVRVPARAQARVALPLFVDEAELSETAASERRWRRVIDVLPAGAGQAIQREEAPLYVSRGSTAAGLGLVAALVAGGLGALLLALRLRRWLQAPSGELMTIALFSALTLIVSAFSQLLAMGAAALLGPFGILFTGLIDDAFRTTLLATLLTLRPRPGTAALAALTGWLLSGLALGNFAPTDLVLVGGRVFWLEGWLWLAGVSRVSGWVDGPPFWRWARLAFGLGFASLCSNAAALALFATLYRLWYAGWYAALVLGGPGFLYPVIACALAVPFADSLRRIAR